MRRQVAGSDLPRIDPQVLAKAVADLGVAIADGECTPRIVELEAIAELCDQAQLPGEARRVRGWITVMVVPEVHS